MVLLTSCFGEEPVHGEVRFHNETGVALLHYTAPIRLNLEQRLAQPTLLNSIEPGDRWTYEWGHAAIDTDERPLCERGLVHYFVSHIDIDLRWRARTDDPTPRIEDLIVVATLVEPCWDDDRASYIVTADGTR